MNCHHDISDRAGPVAPPKPWVAQATSLSCPATGRTERGGAPNSAANADLPVARPSRLRVQRHLCRNHRAQFTHGVQPKNTKTPEITLLSLLPVYALKTTMKAQQTGHPPCPREPPVVDEVALRLRCLRSRHFEAWLRRGLAHDAMAIQTTQLSQGFTKLNA